jgi:hypothetical protein
MTTPVSCGGATPYRPQTIDLKIHGDTLNIDIGEYKGDISKAEKYLKEFCAKNKVEYSSRGHGGGTLTVNGENHRITPFGIDLDMMLKFCNYT